MSLTTRCPNCGTAFRVQPTQLSARGGKVRCGRCANVFDGVAALVQEGAATANAPSLPEAEPSPQLALFESARKTPVLGAALDAANEDAAVPEFLEEPAPRPRRWLLTLGVLLGFVALTVQLYYYRVEIATSIAERLPEVRQYLVDVCRMLDCELKLARHQKRMAIESSDLQADGRREGVIVLNAVIRNQAPFAQEYPALELTLTDDRDEALVRRVLRPADYLAGVPAERVAQGIGPGADVALRMYFDTGGLKAVGYRMYLFFP
jgi:predicted Zn finger-like uncharacterized protein